MPSRMPSRTPRKQWNSFSLQWRRKESQCGWECAKFRPGQDPSVPQVEQSQTNTPGQHLLPNPLYNIMPSAQEAVECMRWRSEGGVQKEVPGSFACHGKVGLRLELGQYVANP